VIDVVIPVCGQEGYTAQIIRDMTAQTFKPATVFIIDNGNSGMGREICKAAAGDLNIKYLPQLFNIGVNPSWNLGMGLCTAEIIAVLNNDLRLPNKFFEKIQKTFDENADCGGCVPLNLETVGEFQDLSDNRNRVEQQFSREGWAFSLRRDVWQRSESMPDNVRTFFGDDYWFERVHACGYRWLKMIDNRIFHFVSQSLYDSNAIDDWHGDLKQWEAFNMACNKAKKEQVQTHTQVQPEQNKPEAESDNPVIRAAYTPAENLPCAVDMVCYRPFYAEAVKKAVAGRTGCAVALEIGARYGCSSRIIYEALKAEGAAFNFTVVDAVLTGLLLEMCGLDGVSIIESTAEVFATAFPDAHLDFLHIDCDPHEYGQTVKLINLYAPKMKRGGVMIFHDCTASFGVYQAVKEFAERNEYAVTYAVPHSDCTMSSPAYVMIG
jgi:hypothetical protein